ncbi:MAG: hypothetical protein IAI50_08365 [Candidatus Eremiobacteraeota bacterium]|nr:hypothetical protein [Candidatus Eremiobacteraeota bacterium]
MFSREGAFAGALWAAAATFGANYGLLVAGNAEPRNGAAMPEERFAFGRNGAWIFAAILSMLVLFLILGPGIPR